MIYLDFIPYYLTKQNKIMELTKKDKKHINEQVRKGIISFAIPPRLHPRDKSIFITNSWRKEAANETHYL